VPRLRLRPPRHPRPLPRVRDCTCGREGMSRTSLQWSGLRGRAVGEAYLGAAIIAEVATRATRHAMRSARTTILARRAAMSQLLKDARFPRSNRYNPAWIMENPMGAHPLWLAEWLCERIGLEPGSRVLDLGCGKAKSSIFLAREYGVQVWATDLWTNATENLARIVDAGLADRVFPIHADARQLPFAGEFFDVVLCIDAYNYFGTDDLYLNYLAHFVRAGGTFAFVSASLTTEFGTEVPAHLRRFWTSDAWNIHTLDWWRTHLSKTRLVEVTDAGYIDDGWQLWLAWARATGAPDWYREMLCIDRGGYLGYAGLCARRIRGEPLAEYAWPATLRSVPAQYEPHPVLRSESADDDGAG
jgi:SAM-dependent methyltransferase